MSREETAGSIEMAFGLWGAVGPSNHVLDGGSVSTYGKKQFWGISSNNEKRWDRVLLSVRDTCRPLAKDAEAIRRVECSSRKRSTQITDDTASCCFFL